MTVSQGQTPSVRNVDGLAGATRVTHDPTCTVVWLSGEHDLATKSLLCDVLALEFAAHDNDMIVDLSEVTFIDCSTVEVLAGGRRWTTEQQRRLSIRAPSRRARRLLDLCRLNEMVDTSSPEVDRPLRSFRSPPHGLTGSF